MARSALPARRVLRRWWHELRDLLGGGGARRAVPVRRRRQGDALRPARARGPGLARLPAADRARAALRLPRARPVRPRPAATGATPPSCCSTRTRRRSTARSTGTRRCTPTGSPTTTRSTTSTRRPTPQRSVVINPFFDWANDRPLRIPYHETVIYEAHVRAMTMRHPGIPADIRGTYMGLVHPVMIDHFKRLGVTAVELMPVHQFVHDHVLADRGLRNYWGYNTIGFFAPHNDYASFGTAGPAGPGVQVDGQAVPPRGHRGHPRRRLQPHRRGQPPRARRCRSAGSTTPATTGSSPTTRTTTTTPPAPGTASTSASTSRCG